jgi:DHA2 family multidrug resistance protein
MPVVAVLTSKLDNRWLIATGFLGFAITAYWMSQLTLEISQWSLLWPIILSGSAMGLVFVPLSTTAVGTLANEQIGNASGLYNLLRNIGGSVGISIVDTIVSRHEQIHRAELVRYLAPGAHTQPVIQKLHTLMQLHTGPHLARLRAYAILNRSLDQQAAVYSYVDDLRYLALVCVLCVPIVFMLRKVKAKKGAAAAAH